MRPFGSAVMALSLPIALLVGPTPHRTGLSLSSSVGPTAATPLQEFVSDHANGRIWNSYDQSQGSAGPPILGTPSAVYYTSQGLAHVYAEGANGDLVEYIPDHDNGRVWNAYDLSVDAGGGGPVSGSPTAIYDDALGMVIVYVEASNGDLMEYVPDHAAGRVWNAWDLSTAAGSGPVSSAPAAVYDTAQSLVHVYAAGPNGDLVEYLADGANGRAWNAYDQSVSAGGGPVSGTPSAVYDTSQDLIHVYAEASDGDLVEYIADHANGRTWNVYDQSVNAGGGSSILATPSAVYDTSQDLIHVYVEASDGDLVEYIADHANGRVWNAYDQSIYAGGGTFVSGTPDAVYLPDQDLIHVYVRASDNDLMEYIADHANGRVWNAYDLSSGAGGPSIGSGSSALELGRAIHVFVGGPVPIGGLAISHSSSVPDTSYGTANVVSLTFDDGPSPAYTPQILQILETYRVPATFEIVGSQGAQYPNLLEQEFTAGFGLANHTWDHVDLTRTSPSGWVAEVDRTSNLIESITGRPVACVRPPYGYTNGSVISQLAQRGLGELMWDVDPSDYARPGASVIAQRVLNALHPGAIVILHDGGGDRSQTVAALPAIINGARAAGYTFVGVCG